MEERKREGWKKLELTEEQKQHMREMFDAYINAQKVKLPTWDATEPKLPKGAMDKYKSPVEVLFGDYMKFPPTTIEKLVHDSRDKLEAYVMQTITTCGVKVNKQELLKALKYDRDQYAEGFADGVKAGRILERDRIRDVICALFGHAEQIDALLGGEGQNGE